MLKAHSPSLTQHVYLPQLGGEKRSLEKRKYFSLTLSGKQLPTLRFLYQTNPLIAEIIILNFLFHFHPLDIHTFQKNLDILHNMVVG